jgi:hypothetical protein
VGAGVDVDTGKSKGRLATDANALRFVEVTVNGPKTWSLAARCIPTCRQRWTSQDRAAVEIVGWVAQHATTGWGRGGGRCRCRWSGSRPR